MQKSIAQLEEIQKKLASSKKSDRGQYRGVGEELTIAKSWLAHAEGNHDQALRQLRSIADEEQGEAESSQGIPVHEMIGDMLLEAKRPAEALAEYETALKTNPGRFNSLYGAALAAQAAGNTKKAKSYYSLLVKNCEGSQSERAELKAARQEMEKLAKAPAQTVSYHFVSPIGIAHSALGH